jgi:hypothetical protein
MQVVKLSDDSCKLPEQAVSLEFDVMVLVEIVSLKVTSTVVETETFVELSAGLTEETVGAVVSVVVVVVLSEVELLLLVFLAQLLSINVSNTVSIVKIRKKFIL